jgi:hypothetical protein
MTVNGKLEGMRKEAVVTFLRIKAFASRKTQILIRIEGRRYEGRTYVQ